jgi:hypothetical protein
MLTVSMGEREETYALISVRGLNQLRGRRLSAVCQWEDSIWIMIPDCDYKEELTPANVEHFKKELNRYMETYSEGHGSVSIITIANNYPLRKPRKDTK